MNTHKDKGEVKFSRIWAMPNRWTFTIKPIRELLMEEIPETLLHQESSWADPFAGNNSPAVYTNDVNINTNAKDHEDALGWLKHFTTESLNGVLYDPPYSITQARMYGKNEFASMKYWADCKNQIARIIKPGGKAICFGWSSMGLGKGRGFSLKRVLLVPHGGSKNDTIVTVEQKL